MRYRGIRRKSREGATDAYASSPPDQAHTPQRQVSRPRSNQPRDRWGRFRKAGRDDEFAAPGPVRDEAREAAEAMDDSKPSPAVGRRRRTGPSWRDFELDTELPRAEPHPPGIPAVADGRRHCGALEPIIYRQWDAFHGAPTPEVVRAVDSLAELPEPLKEKLAAGLDGIYVGEGGVPDLDDMGHLKDHPLPSGRATWDICAGAYGDRKIVVGDRPSPTPDVMMHEIGHALDDIDGDAGHWQSDSDAFRSLYEQCLPHLASDFHRQPAELGRREFFADAFAAISARQRPALVDMLAGNIRMALDVMLFFNRRYGI